MATRAYKAARIRIGKKLEEYRLGRNLSQREAAEQCGIPRRSWWRIENGLGSIPSEFLPKVCKVLGVTAYELVGV